MPVHSKDTPDSLKAIKGFIARGEEMSRVQTQAAATTAYYSFKMAMSLGIKLNDKTPPVKKFLNELMTDLETAKNNPLVVRDEGEAKLIVEEVAMNAFKRADDVDRRGEADKKTAMTYYTAQTLFEVLKQFSPDGELDPDTKSMCKYAKWKATDIMKAINEGRKPTPGDASGSFVVGGGGRGSIGGSDDGIDLHQQQQHDDAPTATPIIPNNNVATSSRSSFTAAATAATTTTTVTSAPLTSSMSTSTITTSTNRGKLISNLTKAKKEDAIEYIKFAKAAVEAGDAGLAAQRLEAALSLLYE
jgi:vacuolar protein sorting-associated protein VTA1